MPVSVCATTSRLSHSFQSKNALQAQSTCPVLLARYPPDYPKPRNQRLPCPLKKCPCNHRGLMRTCRALKQPTFQFPSLAVTTDRAPEAFRPTQLKQILAARLLCRKALLELRQGFRIVLHTLQYYILGLIQLRGYPHNKISIMPVKIKNIKPPPILSKPVVFILLLQSLTKPLPVKKQSPWGPEEA